MGQPLPNLTEPRWFVCHTKPRCEKKFADLLGREQLDHYLALVDSVRLYGKQKKTFTKPLFPGYVFAQVTPEKKDRLYQQDLLVRALPVDNEGLLLRQIEEIKAVCASGYEAILHPILRRGTRVRVQAGPLQGLEGFVDDPANPRGIVVSVDVLQQGLLVRLPIENLAPLP